MAWGDKPQHVIDMLVGAEHESAADYLARPHLPDHLTFYLSAFWDLANYEGIPFSDLDRYAARYGIDDAESFERFQRLMRRMNTRWHQIVSTPDAEVEEDKPAPRKRLPKPVG